MHPWGLSGPEFLWLYAAGMVLGGAVVLYARRWAGRRTPAEEPSTVDYAEVAYLAGGTDRVVDAAVARLVHSEQFRVSRKGVLSAPTDPASEHPIDRDVHQALGHRSMKAYQLRKRIKAMPDVHALAEMIDTLRPPRSPRARALARHGSMAVLWLVFTVGVVRWVNGVANDLPVGYLTVLLMLTMALIAVFYVVIWVIPTRTPRNDPLLVEARRQLGGVDLVAVDGLSAYPDEALRTTLVASATPPKRKAQKHGAYYSYGAPASSSDSGGGGGGGGCGGGNP